MSDLLPRQYEDFRKKEYWDEFFQKRNEKAFEWYGEYEHLRACMYRQLNLTALSSSDTAMARIQTKIKSGLRVLVIGCGNSELSKEIYDDGFTNIISIDFSELVIDEMKKKHPEMQWRVMDMTSMTDFASGSFDLIVDKGALDALMAADTQEIKIDATKMFLEIQRVLAAGGRYFCVTMAQDFILHHLLAYFCEQAEESWAMTVQEIPRDARKPFVPFLMTATKCSQSARSSSNKATYNAKQFITSNGAARKQWLVHEVEATQWYTMTQGALKKILVGRQEVIELIVNDSEGQKAAIDQSTSATAPVPRFTLRLVDHSVKGPNGSCAVFLIPQGREHEWMFSTEEGAAELASGAGFSRLILASVGRGHHFESTAQVQEELNAKILELAPDTMLANEKIPYLTVEEGLGSRNIVYQGHSVLSGEYFIEEVIDGGDHLRRLVFLSNTNVIQSEVKLVQASNTSTSSSGATAAKKKSNKKKNKKKNAATSVDTSYLAFDYHKGMVAVLHAASLAAPDAANTSSSSHKSLIIGLGGGCLAKYIHDNIPNVAMTACELDPSIVEVAEKYFGFQQDERMTVVIGDGIEYIAQRANSDAADLYDSIIIDVDAKERKVGMSCPPISFVEESFLNNVHRLLGDNGILLINISCRDSALYQQILDRLRRIFSSGGAAPTSVFSLRPSDQDVNSVVFIRKQRSPQAAPTMLKQLKEQGKRKGKTGLPAYVDDELCELIREIQLA